MNSEPRPGLTGIDLDFVHRVYRTSGVLALLIGLFLWEGRGAPSALGWLLGSVLSLGLLAGVEWSVRRFIQPEAQSASRVVLASLLKLLAAAAVLFFAFIAALRGWISLPWVLAGFALPHLVAGLKLAGQWVISRNPAGSGTRPSE